MTTHKVLELFSGIGGMRCGLEEIFSKRGHSAEYVSVDLNEFCNQVYYESYGDRPKSLDITSLGTHWFDAVAADIWTMSPPCQPYTRQGKMKGSDDDRAWPLHHLIQVFGEIKILPKLIILENVKNFETSVSFDMLTARLRSRGYTLQGYLLNPLYMGVPNSRLRFFLVATKGSEISAPFLCNDPAYPDFDRIETASPQRSIQEFLCCSHSEAEATKLEIPRALLVKKSAFCFDVVSPQSGQCLCFTRSYTKYINGTGSVLYEGSDVSEMDEQKRPRFANLESMTDLSGKLRYFCPLEAARLNGFKVNEPGLSLRFTEGCSGSVKYYRAVGNSLNPKVVSFLVDRHLAS